MMEKKVRIVHYYGSMPFTSVVLLWDNLKYRRRKFESQKEGGGEKKKLVPSFRGNRINPDCRDRKKPWYQEVSKGKGIKIGEKDEQRR